MTAERQELIDRVAGLLEAGRAMQSAGMNVILAGSCYRIKCTTAGRYVIETVFGARTAARHFAQGMTDDELRAAIEAAERTT